jgi:hypothetical protein
MHLNILRLVNLISGVIRFNYRKKVLQDPKWLVLVLQATYIGYQSESSPISYSKPVSNCLAIIASHVL